MSHHKSREESRSRLCILLHRQKAGLCKPNHFLISKYRYIHRLTEYFRFLNHTFPRAQDYRYRNRKCIKRDYLESRCTYSLKQHLNILWHSQFHHLTHRHIALCLPLDYWNRSCRLRGTHYRSSLLPSSKWSCTRLMTQRYCRHIVQCKLALQ